MITELLQNYTKSGHKSTILKPLTWFIALLFVSSIAMFYNKRIPLIIPCITLCVAGLVTFIFLGSYVYCLLKNPDLIRSEKFVTDKLMIERGLIGDDRKGLQEKVIDISHENITENTEVEDV